MWASNLPFKARRGNKGKDFRQLTAWRKHFIRGFIQVEGSLFMLRTYSVACGFSHIPVRPFWKKLMLAALGFVSELN